MGYRFTYKDFRYAPKASWLDYHLNKMGGFTFLCNVLTFIPSALLFALFWEIGDSNLCKAISAIFALISLIMFLAGGLILKALNQKFCFTERIAKWERKRDGWD